MPKCAVPSDKLYNSMEEKWLEFLEDNLYYPGDNLSEGDASEMYDGLAEDFGKEYDYNEETIEMAFHKRWYDTFVDDFYKKLEEEGIEIIHLKERA